jgi:hypothetical protein
MGRIDDLNGFYDLLDDLRERVGGYRYLRDCTGKSGWPERGVYFFFEWLRWGDSAFGSRRVGSRRHAWRRVPSADSTRRFERVAGGQFK